MSSAPSLARLPGFRDVVPRDLSLRHHIFKAWRLTCLRYGFEEYDGPPLERLDLYAEKSGNEIVGQLYSFRDKGGRDVALRPEMTPTLARILAERSRGMPKPIRWFSIPQLFRYERSQRGRLREHFQLNVDIVGESGVGADAEVLALAIDAVRTLGLTDRDIVARINDRRLVASVFACLGISDEHHRPLLEVVDKAGRVGLERTVAQLSALGLEQGTVMALRDLVSEGSWERVQSLATRSNDVAAAAQPLGEYWSILEAMGLSDYIAFDFTVVRGLAYYTGIVFELFDRAGELRAVTGGGRYDGLLERVGGESLSAVGFGMGDVVLGELLRDRDLIPDPEPACDCVVAWVGEEQRAPALALGMRLRQCGHRTTYALGRAGLGKQLKAASRAGAIHVVIVGPDEARQAAATVRNLVTGQQELRTVESLLSTGFRQGEHGSRSTTRGAPLTG